MTALLRTAVTPVWLILVLATGISWWLGTDHGVDARTTATVMVLIVAFVKVRFVGLYFMELRHAPLPLRLLFEAWVLVVCATVIGLYLSGE